MTGYSFFTFYEHFRHGKFELITHILLGSVGQWLECFQFAPHDHGPQPGFQLCSPLWLLVDPSSRQTGPPALTGTRCLFLLLCSSSCLSYPTFGLLFIIVCPNPICLQREEKLMLAKYFLWAKHFHVLSYWISTLLSLPLSYEPHFIDEENSEKLLTWSHTAEKWQNWALGFLIPVSPDTKACGLYILYTKLPLKILLLP